MLDKDDNTMLRIDQNKQRQFMEVAVKRVSGRESFEGEIRYIPVDEAAELGLLPWSKEDIRKIEEEVGVPIELQERFSGLFADKFGELVFDRKAGKIHKLLGHISTKENVDLEWVQARRLLTFEKGEIATAHTNVKNFYYEKIANGNISDEDRDLLEDILMELETFEDNFSIRYYSKTRSSKRLESIPTLALLEKYCRATDSEMSIPMTIEYLRLYCVFYK